MKQIPHLFSFELSVKGAPWGPTTINAASAGKAKAIYLSDVRDAYPDMPYTLLRVRRMGRPQTTEDFIRCATYRGLPNVRCGDRVRVGRGTGAIVGHNSSANFDVLFDMDSPEYAGLVLNVHPASLEFDNAPSTAPGEHA